MENIPSFNELIEKSIIDHWDLDSLTDYKGKTLQSVSYTHLRAHET